MQPPAYDEETRALGKSHDQRRPAPQQHVSILPHVQAAASTKAGSEKCRLKTWPKFQSHLQPKGQPPTRDEETRAPAKSHVERRHALQQYVPISPHGQAAASTKAGAEKRRRKTRLSHLWNEEKPLEPTHQKA